MINKNMRNIMTLLCLRTNSNMRYLQKLIKKANLQFAFCRISCWVMADSNRRPPACKGDKCIPALPRNSCCRGEPVGYFRGFSPLSAAKYKILNLRST